MMFHMKILNSTFPDDKILLTVSVICFVAIWYNWTVDCFSSFIYESSSGRGS
jgi:hypothetical protein